MRLNYRIRLSVAPSFFLLSPTRGEGPGARGQASRARAALLAGAVLFLATQAGLNLGIRSGAFPDPDPVFEEKLDILRGHPVLTAVPSDSIRVLAVGSSRTQLGFDAGRFAQAVRASASRPTEAFNFGTPAAGPMVCSLYLRRLEEAGLRPDHVLLEIHPGFITPHEPTFEARWLHTYRLRPDETAVVRGYGWDVPDPPHHGWLGWVASSYAYRFSLLNRYAPKWLPTPYGLMVGGAHDAHGWQKGPTVPRDVYPKLLRRAWEQYADTFTGYHVGGPGVAAVRDVLARCRDRGVRVSVVLMPESSEYRAWYGPAGYAEVTAFGRGLTAEFGAPLLDARRWVVDDLFTDGHHLTPDGAAAFTDRLAREWLAIHAPPGGPTR